MRNGRYGRGRLWYYRDNQSTTQGPFDDLQMRCWYDRGFFDDDTLLCQSDHGEFISLKTQFAKPRAAFVTSPVATKSICVKALNKRYRLLIAILVALLFIQKFFAVELIRAGTVSGITREAKAAAETSIKRNIDITRPFGEMTTTPAEELTRSPTPRDMKRIQRFKTDIPKDFHLCMEKCSAPRFYTIPWTRKCKEPKCEACKECNSAVFAVFVTKTTRMLVGQDPRAMHLLLVPKHKLMFCYIEKVASATLNDILCSLNKNTQLSQISRNRENKYRVFNFEEGCDFGEASAASREFREREKIDSRKSRLILRNKTWTRPYSSVTLLNGF